MTGRNNSFHANSEEMKFVVWEKLKLATEPLDYHRSSSVCAPQFLFYLNCHYARNKFLCDLQKCESLKYHFAILRHLSRAMIPWEMTDFDITKARYG